MAALRAAPAPPRPGTPARSPAALSAPASRAARPPVPRGSRSRAVSWCRRRGPDPHASPPGAAPKGQGLPRPAAGGVWPSVGAVAPSLCGHRRTLLTHPHPPPAPKRTAPPFPLFSVDPERPELGACPLSVSACVRAYAPGARPVTYPRTTPPQVPGRRLGPSCAGADRGSALRSSPPPRPPPPRRQLLCACASVPQAVGSAEARAFGSVMVLRFAKSARSLCSWCRPQPCVSAVRRVSSGLGTPPKAPECRESGRTG